MRTPIARCLLATVGILLVPASALAIPQVGERDNGFSITDETYLRTYEKCWKAFDSQCGRNIVDDGLSSGKPPPEQRVKESTATMQRWLNPAPEPTAVDSPAIVASAPAQVSVPAAPVSSGDCPSYMADEASYSTQYNAQGSGAYGCFQIMPGTRDAYGCDLSTMEGQVSCAGAICADVGATAWESSGADPCPYVQP